MSVVFNQKDLPTIAHRQIVLKSAVTQLRWDWEAQARQVFGSGWMPWLNRELQSLKTKNSKLKVLKKDKRLIVIVLRKLLLYAYQQGAMNGLEALGFSGSLKSLIRKKSAIDPDIVFFLTNEEVIAAIEGRADDVAGWVMTEVVSNGNKIVAETLAKGGSLNDAREALAKYLKEGASGWKSYQIANTEFHVGLSRGRHDVYVRSGVKRKRWVTVGDNRVRETHQMNEREGWLPIDKEFPNGAMHPGDGPDAINCFIDGKVSILTKEGWDEIQNIKPGRMVMTHLGEFKPVTRLFRGQIKKGEAVVRIRFGEKNKVKSNNLGVTPEHPFLTQRGWVPAKDLTVDDTLMILATECPYCGKLKAHYHNACSKSCASHHIATEQWDSIEHRENVGDKAQSQMWREYANGTRSPDVVTKAREESVRKFGPRGFIGSDPKHSAGGRAAIVKKYGSQGACLKARAIPALIKIIRAGGRTSTERSMHKWLTKRGLTFIEQFVVGNRRVDFYVPDQKLFIECDGWFYHQDKEHERIRDLEILLKHPDHRIEHYTYHGDVTVESFTLETLNHAGAFKFIPCKIHSVEKNVLKAWRPLFNFAVQDAESYVSNGVVSHNCRCVEEADLSDPSINLVPWSGD